MSSNKPSKEPTEKENNVIEENINECPGCWNVGDKTDRVGTLECDTDGCRVRLYQQGFRKK